VKKQLLFPSPDNSCDFDSSLAKSPSLIYEKGFQVYSARPIALSEGSKETLFLSRSFRKAFYPISCLLTQPPDSIFLPFTPLYC